MHSVFALSFYHDFHKEVKAGQDQMLSISLLSSCRGHPGLAKYCTVWATLAEIFY